MAERCGADVPEDIDEYNRDERIETYYQGWGARDMAGRIVELEDELGADVDGICTGMHADVAEAHAEIERLKELLQYEHNRANSAIDREETAERAAEEVGEERDRYRLAWLSARRRAADEANFGMEALVLRDVEIARLRAELEQRQTFSAPRLECVGEDEHGEVWCLDRGASKRS